MTNKASPGLESTPNVAAVGDPESMQNVISTKCARVIVIEPSGPIRHLMSEVVKSLGFASVTAMASCKDALGYLEVETADWVITPILSGDNINALQLLYLRTCFPELKRLTFSVLVDEAEKYVLPMAFSMGLVSFHPKATTRDIFSDEINGFIMRLSQYEGKTTLVAGSYFRPWLQNINKPDLLLNADEAMCRHIPGDPALLMNLAQSLYVNNRKTQAHRVIGQVEILDPTFREECEQFRAQNPSEPAEMGAVAGAEVGSATFDALGVKCAIVIDSDSTTQNTAKTSLASMGVANIETFTDGAAARDWLERQIEPGLVIMEWRIPKISGPAMIQDIRSRGFHTTPIIIVSSLVGKEDLPLLREMGVSNVIAKPLSDKLLLKGIVECAQEARHPTNTKTAEIKIRALLNEGHVDEAERVWAENRRTFSEFTKLELVGEFSYVKKNFEQAARQAIEALKVRSESIFALNLLGKALMRLSDYASAVKCFEKAQAMSPQNIERLCNISRAHHALGNEGPAEAAMGQAKKLDATAQPVQENSAIHAIETDNVPLARQIMKGMSQLTNMVSYLNNQAVALALAGRTDDGIVLYRRTLDAIPDDKDEIIGIVNYNLALAYIRGKRPSKEAIEFVTVAVRKASPDVRRRAKSLKKRLISAGENRYVELRHAEKGPASDAASNGGPPGDLPVAENGGYPAMDQRADSETGTGGTSLHDSIEGLVLSKPGEMGLHMIFSQTDMEIDQRARAFIAKVPRFARREKIKRAETFGVERSSKAGQS